MEKAKVKAKEEEKSGRLITGMQKALIFSVLFALLVAFLCVGYASAATDYVNPGESIQAAVDDADPGDTIIVRDGTYIENINVDKSGLCDYKRVHN
jgi:hypothetical protein